LKIVVLILVGILSAFSTTGIYAQAMAPHVLAQKLDSIPTLSAKLDYIIFAVDKHFYSLQRTTHVLEYLEIAEALPIETNDLDAIHRAKYLNSWVLEHNNQFEEKLKELKLCRDYFKDNNDELYRKSLYYLGELYFRTGRLESAQKYLLKLIAQVPEIHHRFHSIATRKLVRTYNRLKQEETALELISDLIIRYEGDSNFQWDIKHMRHYMVKGLVLAKMGRIQEAIEYTKTARAKSIITGNKIIQNNCNSELARYNLSLGNLEKAKKLAHEAYNHYEILKLNFPSMTSTRVTLGNIYLKQENYSEARKYYNEAIILSKEHHRLYDHHNALRGVLECALKLGDDNDKISQLFQEYDVLKDSLLNVDINLAVQDLKIKYESEAKENAIIQLNKEQKITSDNLKIARRNNFYLLSATLFLLLSGFLLFYLYQSKLKSQRLLEYKNQVIADSLQEKQLLLKEIHHRVKNNLQTVSSLLSLQSNYIKDENVLLALTEGQNRVQSMALIHQNLYQEDDLRRINVLPYFNRLLKGLYSSYRIDTDRIKLNLDVSNFKMNVEMAILIGLITNELVTNVFKYAFTSEEKGELTVSLTNQNKYTLIVSDSGKGIPNNILYKEGESFGYQMIHAFCNKLNADINVNTNNGSTITITIPKKMKTTHNEKNLNRRG